MKAAICIALYAIVFMIMNKYIKRKCISTAYENDDSCYLGPNKISILASVIFAFLLTLVNVYATNVSQQMGGDRKNYLYEYTYGRETTVGLDTLFKISHYLNLDIRTIFYFTTFFCILLILLSYRKIKTAGANTIFFLLCSDIVFYTFVGIKQSYTIAFAALYFANELNNDKGLKNEIKKFFLIILASMFHVTGFILIPIYIYARVVDKYEKRTNFVVFVLIIVMLLFQPICLVVANLVGGIFPGLSGKIIQYFGVGASIEDTSTSMVFLKGIPFYCLAIYGMMFRKGYKEIIKNYDKLFIMTVIGCMFYLLSYQSYWMYRSSSIFYFPMAVFYDNIMQVSSRNNRRVIMFTVPLILLFFNMRTVIQVYSIYGGY